MRKTYPDSSQVNYTFDPAGRLTQVTDPTGTYTFGYDNMNRLTTTGTNYAFDSAGNYTVQYGYDAASNRTSMTDPQSLATIYGYDTLNRMNSLAFNGQNPGFGFGYDVLSRRNSLTRPNGVNTTYNYDPVSQLVSVLHQLGSTTLDGASYIYDSAGNRSSKTDLRTNVTSNYGYDPIYQLTQVTQGSSTTESYTYDKVGNRLSSLGVSPYSYNTSNELTSTPTVTYTYDNNGNTKTKSDGTQFTWDYENRLTKVVPGTGGTVNFKYDPFGRRVQKSFTQGSTTTTTDYLYDGDTLLEEVDNAGNVLAKYTQGPGIDQPLSELRSATTSYYEQDGLNSVTSVSNSAGALANTYSYDSFGKLTSSTGAVTNPFQYTGRELDLETGQYFYRARYLDQNIGRFLSEDPLRFLAGTNFYSYVRNNPAVRIDPTGLIHQAWNEPPFDGRLHDDASGGLEVLCTKGRNIQQDKKWLEHSIFVRSVEIGALGNKADAGHVGRLINEIITLQHCHDECNKDKKPEDVPFEVPPEWNTGPNPAAAAAVAAAAAAAAAAEEYGWVVVFSF